MCVISPHKWKHLDTEECPEVRAVEALTHKVAGRQLVEEMSKADCWRERSMTHCEGPHTQTNTATAVIEFCTMPATIFGTRCISM